MKLSVVTTRLAYLLIGMLLLLVILAAVIPQKEIAQNQMMSWRNLLGDNYAIIETLQLDRIYTSPYFFIILGLLGLNLLVGTVNRFRLIYKAKKPLFRLRYLGSVVFHLSLLLIISGVILNFLFRFEGIMSLTEGQTKIDEEAAYTRMFYGPLYKPQYNRFRITNNSFNPLQVFGGQPTQAVDVEIDHTPNAVPIQSLLRTNHPISIDDLEYHYGLQYGYAPQISIIDSADIELFRHFIRLAIQSKNDSVIHADYYIIHDEKLRIEVEVNPEENNPEVKGIHLSVVQDEKLLYKGFVGLNETVKAGSYHISVPSIRYWCYVNIVESPFLTLIFSGFWLALSGLALTFVSRVINERNSER